MPPTCTRHCAQKVLNYIASKRRTAAVATRRVKAFNPPLCAIVAQLKDEIGIPQPCSALSPQPKESQTSAQHKSATRSDKPQCQAP
eukprot:3657480-Pleurochrysis_carterae.AAC.1